MADIIQYNISLFCGLIEISHALTVCVIFRTSAIVTAYENFQATREQQHYLHMFFL